MRSKYPHIYNAFDALKGLRELLAEKERVIVTKPDYSEDYLAILDERLKSLKVGDLVQLVVLEKNEYILVEGVLTKIDFTFKYLQIVKSRYYIANICDLNIL